MTKIIGVGHYSRTGKDTFTNFFLEAIHMYAPKMKACKKSFAWKLKQITHELYAWAGLREPEYYETSEGASARKVKLPILNLTPVEIWVQFGTKAVRDNVYDRTWLDYLLKSPCDEDIIIIPDVRFPNEAQAIKDTGGLLIKIVRPGYGPLNTVADKALLGYKEWDYIFGSHGMAGLKQAAFLLAGSFAFNKPLPHQSTAAKALSLTVEKI